MNVDDTLAAAHAARATAAAAARAAAPDPTVAAAARLLGVPAREVAAVELDRRGVLITTTDDVRYIVVPDERPDAEGKSGVMLLDPPGGREPFTKMIAGELRHVDPLRVVAGRTTWRSSPMPVYVDGPPRS